MNKTETLIVAAATFFWWRIPAMEGAKLSQCT